jgi:hypothetical protein
LGQKNQPHQSNTPPTSGIEQKAKARAQKYLYDSQEDIDKAREEIDIFGHKDNPTEPPHTVPNKDGKDSPENDTK